MPLVSETLKCVRLYFRCTLCSSLVRPVVQIQPPGSFKFEHQCTSCGRIYILSMIYPADIYIPASEELNLSEYKDFDVE